MSDFLWFRKRCVEVVDILIRNIKNNFFYILGNEKTAEKIYGVIFFFGNQKSHRRKSLDFFGNGKHFFVFVTEAAFSYYLCTDYLLCVFPILVVRKIYVNYI